MKKTREEFNKYWKEKNCDFNSVIQDIGGDLVCKTKETIAYGIYSATSELIDVAEAAAEDVGKIDFSDIECKDCLEESTPKP